MPLIINLMYLTILNSDHRIILSCTKSVRVLFERKKSNRLKPPDVTYNGKVIPSSSSVKFLGITFDSALTFISHFHTVATIELYLLFNLWPLYLYPQPPYKSYIHSLFVNGAPATCVASPDIQLNWEMIQTHSISQALSILSFIHNDRKRQHAYLPPIHDRNLYLAKHWYSRVMQQNRG